MSEILNLFRSEEERELAIELFSRDNVDVKTELHNPTLITILEVFAENMRELDPTVSAILSSFVKRFKVNMISFNRKSRSEFVNALRALIPQEEEEEEPRKSRLLKP